MFKYIQFINEVRKSKLEVFKNPNISNILTSSIEIELESFKLKDSNSEYTSNQVLKIIDIIRNSLMKELSRSQWIKIDKKIIIFIDDILSELENDYDDDDYILDNILSEKKYKKNPERLFIVQILRPMVINYFFKENFNYLVNKFKSNFPNFYKKWSKDLKFELDNTLDRGIEFSNSSYFSGINDLISLINDFYEEYDKNEKWKFKDTTGIHINIGSKSKSEINPIKGILFLDDSGENPFVFKNMNWRKNNKYCGSLKSFLKNDISIMEKSKKLLDNGDVKECERILNDKIQSILIKEGYKNFGLNLLNLDKNYVEFRYPGGEISKDVLIDKLLYFTYVYFMMIDSEYDKREYHKKLYKFLN